MTNLADRAAEEVRALHAAFVDLFTGRALDCSRCAAVLAQDFWMISPDGLCLDRDRVLKAIAAATAPPDFSIRIRNIRTVGDFGDSVLLHYIEEQYRNRKTTRRLSTALFTAETRAPSGVVWRYLHETWMLDPTAGE